MWFADKNGLLTLVRLPLGCGGIWPLSVVRAMTRFETLVSFTPRSNNDLHLIFLLQCYGVLALVFTGDR